MKPTGKKVIKEDSDSASTCLCATQALCNICGRTVDAQIKVEDTRVVLAKWCLEHGLTQSLVSSDVDWYLKSLAYVKPATQPLERALDSFEGCPQSCGLCPQHQQHTCVPILEITDRCDLDCPICLTSGRVPGELTVDQIRFILDNLIRYEGKINMLTLSGGEPTQHPDFLEVLDACRRPEIGLISVSTNGVHLSQNQDLIKAIRDREVVISLQYDGARAATYQTLRGRSALIESKNRFIEKAVHLDAKLSLTATLWKETDHTDIENILHLLFTNDSILSVMFQPLSAIRFEQDPMDRITIADVVKILAGSAPEILKESDFSPLPCSHPSCFALTYLLKLENGRLLSLPSIIDTDSYLDIIKNQALFGTDLDTLVKIKDTLYQLWSSDGMIPERDKVLRMIKRLLLDLNRLGPESPHSKLINLGTQNIKSIFVHHFMDRANFDFSRAVKCCNHYPQADGRLLPACVRNNLLCRI